MLSLIDLEHLHGEILGIPCGKFLHGVDTCSLEQLGELRTDTLNPEKVSVVHPGKDELRAETCSLLKLLASLGGLALLEKKLFRQR